MGPLLWRLSAGIVVTSLLGLGACTNTPSRFYLLNPLAPSAGTSPAAQAERGPVVGLGPITLPRYLDQPQIVSRASRHQLAVGELDRWAEPLQENVSRVLADNLSLLIPTDHLLVQEWPRSVTLDYQVKVDVRHFDGWLGGESVLIARWSLLDRAERELVSRKVHLNAPAGGRDYEAMVVAMNQLLDTLSRDIAAAIQRLPPRAAARE
jgi:uncharacterized lipoprotein YmbA